MNPDNAHKFMDFMKNSYESMVTVAHGDYLWMSLIACPWLPL